MPYKDHAKQRIANMEAKRRQRQGMTLGMTEHPAILEALVDPVKRLKLEKICKSLKNRGLLREVRYGVYGPTFDVVGELLEVTS